MPPSHRALFVLILSLCSCSDRGEQSTGQPAPVARAPGAGAARVVAPGIERAPATATLQGDVLLGGRLLCQHPFEVRLVPLPEGTPLRQLFGDGSGRFRMWPPAGRYRLRVFAGDLVSAPQIVDLPPGNPGDPLRITVQ